MAGIVQVKNEKDLMAGLERIMGLHDSIELTGKDIAHKIGLGHWSKSLQKKFDLLKDLKRIKVEKAPRKRMLITLLKPLTTKEKKELTASVIFEDNIIFENKLEGNNIDNIEENKIDTIEQTIDENISKEIISEEIEHEKHDLIDQANQEAVDATFVNTLPEIETQQELNLTEVDVNVDDIDALFDDITNKTRNVFSSYKAVKDERDRLRVELEISKKREQHWMQRAIQYQSQL